MKITKMLTIKQQQVVDIIQKGKSVMMSGPGGTGKTFLIKYICSLYEQSSAVKNGKLAITAMTGMAAILINGTTLHSFLGIGIGKGDEEELISRIGFKKNTWIQLQTLIIDEVSMMSAELFDKLESVARRFRSNSKPFGGIQLILSGDFLQMPCVEGKFCFTAKTWSSCITSVVIFDEILRQKNCYFQQILNRARFGEITDDDIKYINSNCSPPLSPNEIQTEEYKIQPTTIFCKNVDVDNINFKNLMQLPNSKIYKYTQHILGDNTTKNTIKEIQPEIFLAEGAQVMLTVNFDLNIGLVNGSRGVVVGFEKHINHFNISGFNSCTSHNNSVIGSKKKIFPIVRFSKITIVVKLHKYEIINKKNKVLKTVYQIPLKLAYAITVHKSMGMTIDYALVDLKGVFEYGQAYVALSRVRDIKDVCVKNLEKFSFKAHPAAVNFYRTNPNPV